MKRTFLCLLHASDCAEECEVIVERVEMWGADASWGEEVFTNEYRLVSWPASCKCGRPMPLLEVSQDDLRAAYALPEAEDV